MNKFCSRTKLRNFLTIFKYDPNKYWKKRGKEFYKDRILYDKEQERLEEKKLLDYLSELDFDTVFEFGCGYGRYTDLLLKKFPHIKEYMAIDLSSDLINNAKKYVNSKKVDFEVSTIQDFKPQKKYDLVFGVAVCMHIMPKETISVIEKLVSLSKKHVLNVDWYDRKKPKIRLSGHCFLHDYKTIYHRNPSVSSVKIMDFTENPTRASIFHAKIKQLH